MRVLFLNHNVAWSGGTFFRAMAVAREMATRGHAMSLLTISPKNRWAGARGEHEGVEVLESPDLLWGVGRTGWDPYDVLWRCAALRRRSWDVIHAWDSRPVVILPALFARSRNPDAKLFIDWADWWGRGGTQTERRHGLVAALYGPIETFFEERFRRRADGSTVISRALERRAIGLGVPSATILRLPQGCDPVNETRLDRAPARERLGLPSTAPILLSVGKLLPADAALLFEAAGRLFARRPDARLVLIGRHGASVPASLRATGRLTEAGFVPDDLLRSYMAACDALVVALADTIASRARWPSKANAFLARGRAVIMTRVGDLPALLAAHDAAFLSEPNAAALAEAMERATVDAGRRAQVEARARRLVHEQLAWPTLVDQLLAFYADRAPAAGRAASSPPHVGHP